MKIDTVFTHYAILCRLQICCNKVAKQSKVVYSAVTIGSCRTAGTPNLVTLMPILKILLILTQLTREIWGKLQC